MALTDEIRAMHGVRTLVPRVRSSPLDRGISGPARPISSSSAGMRGIDPNTNTLVQGDEARIGRRSST